MSMNFAVITPSKDPSTNAIFTAYNGELPAVLAMLKAASELSGAGGVIENLTTVLNAYLGAENFTVAALSTMNVDNGVNGTYLVDASYVITERYGDGSNPDALSVTNLDELSEVPYYEAVLEEIRGLLS
ncbi:hypothetical protein [Methylovorus glucosotrophus]|uniref:Uncharacterized protein n=1 Tax=Methylovorus glucosotrophus (strain SIP3-4) TaxID=582744 RepID=C6XE82_METGS|nr:hypothetical protein [Methylovorus glucosotrophus]ACT50857.1 hypothetical protein Msip34_1612 [Methylovorus glucosotrophus SIP3-4]